MLLMIQGESHAKKIFPYDYKVTVLDNGLKIITIPMQSNGIIAYYTVVRTGSRDEYEPGHTGFAHFFEHMMFRGTKKYPGSVYDKLITSMGANANAYTTDDYTCYHLTISKEDLEKVMELESDRFQNLYYEERDFQTEAGAVYGEYRKDITSPYFMLEEKMAQTAYDKHTYKHTTMGFEKDIAAMPTMYNYSRTFFNRYYRPDNTVLLIVGDFENNSTLDLVKKYYSPWKKGYVVPTIEKEPEQKGERQASVKYTGKTLPILTISYKSDSFQPENKMVVSGILLAELAFGESSDLYKKLYLKEQKVQSFGADLQKNRDPSLFSIFAMIKKEGDIDYIKSEIDKTITSFQKNPIDDKKLTNMKSNTKYSYLMNLDTPEKVAGGLARYIALTGGIEAVDKFYTTIENINTSDIQQAATKYLQKERRTVVTLKGGK